MTQQALFAIAAPPEPDLERTGGLHVAADETFAADTRLQLDEISWVDHVQGWPTTASSSDVCGRRRTTSPRPGSSPRCAPGRGSTSGSAIQPELSSVLSQRLQRWPSSGLPAFPVLYGQCWPGMILQGQLLFPSQEAVDSLDK